jgi:AraC family transcriptional regulator, transcriptional activator of the genes for pyochelin and ferripyochelin receptors
MSISLAKQDWCELWKESLQNGAISCRSDSFSTLEQGCLANLCQVYERWVQLRGGLSLYIYEYEPFDDLILNEGGYDHTHFALSFFVLGNVKTILHSVTSEVQEKAGNNYLSYYSGIKETEFFLAGQRILRVKLLVDLKIFLETFGAEQLEPLPRELRPVLEGSDLQPHYRIGVTVPAMQVVLQQLLNCPYHGLMQRIYLESKALELMTLQFAQFLEDKPCRSQSVSLRSDDIERIHQAKAILIKRMENPPSLLELARQVGVNDHKLKQGFRQVFGTTAFGYLHQHRLEQARQLLEADELSVTQIACKIGFADSSYFAAAFRKRFGLNPRSYRQEHRQKLSQFEPKNSA